jgi:hypothetical protein
MLLSPWFAPRYVWAAIEGAAGLVPGFGRPRIVPHIPADWSWIAARNVPLGGTPCSWVVVRTDALRILVTRDVESDLAVERFARDVTGEVRVEGEDPAVVALADERRILVFVGNREPHTVTVAVPLEGALQGRRPARRFEGLRNTWHEVELDPGSSSLPLRIARGGFALVEFV